MISMREVLRPMRRWLSTARKPLFFDMQHSNNAARIRLWIALKGLKKNEIDVKMIAYPDLQTPEFAAINPLKKVPALIREDGVSVFESNVILNYLEDKYSAQGSRSFLPPTPEGRQLMDLIVRCHDLYVASPNCTAPGFSHSQGAMYLAPYETKFCSAARTIDRPSRAAKIQELYKQLIWLEENMSSEGPYLAGEDLSLADFTWYPTTIFMEFMLPRVFGWPGDVLHDIHTIHALYTHYTRSIHALYTLYTRSIHTLYTHYTHTMPDIFRSTEHLPRLSLWWQNLTAKPEFAKVREDIFSFWEQKEIDGQFESILGEVADKSFQWTYFLDENQPSQQVMLEYQEAPPPGKRTGRYINQPDGGMLSDVHVPCATDMHNGRLLSPSASLESHGFALLTKTTSMPSVDSFRNDEEMEKIYYKEMMDLVQKASGASWVHIFDHTLRESGNSNLNATKGETAAPVPRVHCDYTINGAPTRLAQLGQQGLYSKIHNRELTQDEMQTLLSKRFAFINVWRSIDADSPVMRNPLAVCDESSVSSSDKFLYELHFPDRIGENYSLQSSPKHMWYYYPKMQHDECLVFKVYDRKEKGPRFVFHTSFNDPHTPPNAPARRSIEVRAIAFFD